MDDMRTWFGLQQSYHQMVERERTNRLQELVEPLQKKNDMVSAELLRGRPAIEITRAVLQHGIDLVIKDARGTTDHRTLLVGSTDMRLLRNCPCPVWLVGPITGAVHERILTAVDPHADDEEHRNLNRRIIELASSLAETENADLYVVSAWNAPGECFLSGRMAVEQVTEYISDTRRHARHGLNRLLTEVGLDADDIHVRCRKGEATDVILEFVEEINCDLLVMGTVVQSRIDNFLMGNTADTVLRHIKCSVLTVKPDGFISPVTL